MIDKPSFIDLTPDSILSCAEAFGIVPSGSFLQLNSLENRVYRVDATEGSPLILKFYRPGRWNRSQIEEEHSFCAELAGQGVPVAAALKRGEGWTIAHRGFLVAAWHKTPGRIPDELSPSMLSLAGHALGKLHAAGAGKVFSHRLRLNTDSLIRQPLAWLLEQACLPADIAAPYAETANDLAARLDQALADMPCIRLHGDVHWGNLLWDGQALALVDFDDCAMGPPVQDLWMICPALDEAGLRDREVLLAAYREHAPFDEAWFRSDALLRAARIIHHSAWVARRRDDASFMRTFVEYGSRDYWSGELSELVRLSRRDPLSLTPPQALTENGVDVSTLQNSDYFFDMD